MMEAWPVPARTRPSLEWLLRAGQRYSRTSVPPAHPRAQRLDSGDTFATVNDRPSAAG